MNLLVLSSIVLVDSHLLLLVLSRSNHTLLA